MISRATWTAIYLAVQEIEKTIIKNAETMKHNVAVGLATLIGGPEGVAAVLNLMDEFNPHELAHEVLKG